MFKLKTLCLWVLTCCITVSLHAQKKQLTNAQYFENKLDDIVQPLPVVLRFENDKEFVMMKDRKSFLVNALAGTMEEYKGKPDGRAEQSVKIKDHDIFLNDRRITSTPEQEKNPVLSPDGQYIAFTRNNDLYTYHIETSREIRITQDGSELILNGYASWVYMEEILGRRSNYRAFWWSPDSKHLAFFRSNDTRVPEYTLTDDGGAGGYVEKLRYPKPGDANPEIKIGIVASGGGNITWCDFNETDDQYFGLPYWKPDGNTLLVQWMNRAQNELKIYEVQPANGSKSLWYEERTHTWINLDDEGDRLRFLSNGNLLLLSNNEGYNHIYLHNAAGKRLNAVTSGPLMVEEILWNNTKDVIFTARTRANSTRVQIFRASLNGKKIKQLTSDNYHHTQITVSPNAKHITYTYGNAQTPNAIAILSENGKAKDLHQSRTAGFDDYQLALTEILRIKSEDGKFDLPIRIIQPLNMEPGKKYPVLISIYGGPARNDVMDNWRLSGTQQWFAKEGLMQVILEHRGSSHFGKEGTDYLHHNLGYWEMTDYITQVKWLIANRQADPERIAITGFSYGGYLSAYALTYGADYFTHGMAGGSVTDWSLYDTHYTERFMGTPKTNPEGYKKSSVMQYTHQYKGMLQLVHGLIDENVHPQHTIRLATDLQMKNKTFEMMLYGGNRHGITGKQGIHHYNLKNRFIYEHLIKKPIPKELLR